MRIAEEFVTIADRISSVTAVPRVRKLHFGTATSGGNKSSKFAALELEDGTVGLTYVDLGRARSQLNERVTAESYVGSAPLELAQFYTGDADWQRVLGMAAINAISMSLIKASRYELTESEEATHVVLPETGDHIGMVGYFPPLVRSIRQTGVRLSVVELDPQWIQQDEGFVVTADAGVLDKCNKIICTGTTLINHTLEDILSHTRNAGQVTLVGPTMGCLPDPLFDRGVTSIGGRQVYDSERFVALWRSGEPWRDAARRYTIVASSYPGFEELLRRASSVQ